MKKAILLFIVFVLCLGVVSAQQYYPTDTKAMLSEQGIIGKIKWYFEHPTTFSTAPIPGLDCVLLDGGECKPGGDACGCQQGQFIDKVTCPSDSEGCVIEMWDVNEATGCVQDYYIGSRTLLPGETKDMFLWSFWEAYACYPSETQQCSEAWTGESFCSLDKTRLLRNKQQTDCSIATVSVDNCEEDEECTNKACIEKQSSVTPTLPPPSPQPDPNEPYVFPPELPGGSTPSEMPSSINIPILKYVIYITVALIIVLISYAIYLEVRR
jgi:hypothetical protein